MTKFITVKRARIPHLCRGCNEMIKKRKKCIKRHISWKGVSKVEYFHSKECVE